MIGSGCGSYEQPAYFLFNSKPLAALRTQHHTRIVLLHPSISYSKEFICLAASGFSFQYMQEMGESSLGFCFSSANLWHLHCKFFGNLSRSPILHGWTHHGEGWTNKLPTATGPI